MQDERLPRPFGPYMLLEVLGAGGAGAVYAARDASARLLVVKILHPAVASSLTQLNRFRHEAEVARKIAHPNVIRVYDAGTIDEQPYIAMEYVFGWRAAELLLRQWKAKQGAPIPIAVSVVRQALSGLSAIHALGMIHRDLSPNNIMIDEHGVVRLIDLGLAKSHLRDWRTATGTVMGSPGYMPPEQVVGEEVGQRADFYPLGVLLYELVLGRRMLAGKTAFELLNAALTHRHRPLQELRSDVPSALDEVVRVATAYEAEQRFSSCAAFIAALDHACPQPASQEEVERFFAEMLGERRQERTQLMMKSTVADTFVKRPPLEKKSWIQPAAIGLVAGALLGGGGVYAMLAPSRAVPIAVTLEAAPDPTQEPPPPPDPPPPAPVPVVTVEPKPDPIAVPSPMPPPRAPPPVAEKRIRAKTKETIAAAPPPMPKAPTIMERKEALLRRASLLAREQPSDENVLRAMRNLAMIRPDSDPEKAEQTLREAERDLARARGG